MTEQRRLTVKYVELEAVERVLAKWTPTTQQTWTQGMMSALYGYLLRDIRELPTVDHEREEPRRRETRCRALACRAIAARGALGAATHVVVGYLASAAMRAGDCRGGMVCGVEDAMSELCITQLICAQWHGDTGLTYSIFGLGDDGAVYRMAKAAGGWKKMSMRALTTDELDQFYQSAPKRKKGEEPA